MTMQRVWLRFFYPLEEEIARKKNFCKNFATPEEEIRHRKILPPKKNPYKNIFQ